MSSTRPKDRTTGPRRLRATTGSSRRAQRAAPGRVTQATRDFCADQAKGVTAWPLDKIAEAVQPDDEQKALLDDLRKASERPPRSSRMPARHVPMTPPGRLEAMIQRLQATDQAVQTVKPALEAFYQFAERRAEGALQRGRPAARPANGQQRTLRERQANCSSDKAGISNLAINRIEQAVRPTDAQGAALDKLDEAMQKAVDTLRDACPNTVAATPVGRLDVMQKRLEAMIAAANIVRPALEEFYTSLNDEQKAKFNRLGRQTAQSGD